MKIFSEIYGAYFRTTEKILAEGIITREKITELIRENAFRDSVLFIPDRIIPDSNNNSSWGLLKKTSDHKFASVLKNPPHPVMTSLQKRWIKTILADSKFCLFMDDSEISALKLKLENEEPLYDSENIFSFDRFSDGDDFSNPLYRKNFRNILEALKLNEIIKITFVTSRGKRICAPVLPVSIEYSAKNDCFRFLCSVIKSNTLYKRIVIKASSVQNTEKTGKIFSGKPDTEKYFSESRCDTPVTVEVSDERNGIERFMMEFASYEKYSIFDLGTGKCTVSIWYDKQDEIELLVTLLSFGPVLEIKGPENFRKQAADRVKSQYEKISEKSIDN